MCAALQRDMNVRAGAVVQVEESPSLMQAWNRLSSYSQESRASLHSEPPQGEEGRDERGGEGNVLLRQPDPRSRFLAVWEIQSQVGGERERFTVQVAVRSVPVH